MEINKELTKMEDTSVATQMDNMPLGFDDDDSEDVIIPRVKVIQDLSPERKEKIAEEGDLINSLTKDKLNGKAFIPVFKFDTHIKWQDRALGGGIECMSRDGKNARTSEGACLNCVQCGKYKFDNSQKGKDAVPLCTAYFNFMGFVEGEHMPIILSFTKTYYSEGKKMYSMAKFRMQNMWNFKYGITSKKMSKNSNTWYGIAAVPAGETTAEDRAYARELFNIMKSAEFKADFEEAPVADSNSTIEVDVDMQSEF